MKKHFIQEIVDQLGISKEQITDLSKTFFQLGGDWLDSFDLRMTLEGEFKIKIETDELSSYEWDVFLVTKTISEIQSLIQKKLNITE